MNITNLISHIFGLFAKAKFPLSMQRIINKSYVKMFDICLDEFDDLNSYDSLNALFTRKIKKPRNVSDNKNDFISPCDGFITKVGNISNDKAFQIKGRSYSIEELLTDMSSYKDNKNLFKNGNYANFYLSPKDYHCYHAPCDMIVEKSIHVAGKLLPVNIASLNKNHSLFTTNERVILKCKSLNKKLFYMVFVGALNVGSMKFVFNEEISTNNYQNKNDTACANIYDDVKFNKGDMLGNFEMGSTIVILSQEDFLEFNIKDGDNVLFSNTIAVAK